MFDQPFLVKLLAPGEDRLRHRHADGSAEIAGDIDQRGSLVGLTRLEAGIGGGGDEIEHQRQTYAEIDARPCEKAEVQVAIKPRQVVHRRCDDAAADGNGVFRLDETESADQRENTHRHDAAGR